MTNKPGPDRSGLLICLVPIPALLLALIVAPPPLVKPAAAQTPEVLRWLNEEPLTLLDYGLIRLRRDLREAAALHADPEYPDSPPRAGAFYGWRSQSLQAYATIPTSVEKRTADRCRRIFTDIIGTVTAHGPLGSGRVERYLEEVFGHAGPRYLNRGTPRNLGRDLMRIMRFTVTLTGDTADQRYGDLYSLKCHGPLDAAPDDVTIEESGA